VPKGQPQKGLRIPIYSPDGKLMMSFQIGVAEVVDADNIKMGELRMETFKEDGEHEFDIELPDSIFNAKTKELTSKAHVKIKRHDFEITGNSMTFNTETKVGKFGGGVKMVIYDASAAVAAEEPKPAIPAIEIKPVEEEKK
jgi:Lipopolysaccharide-assembly, LptC-related